MKILRRLEKKRYIWLLITLCTVFFLLRLPSLIEPYWYGDEGIYQVISLAMQDGRYLYSEIWDNKPPLLYVTYFLFSGDQFSVRLLSSIVGVLSVITFFFLSRKLLGYTAGAIATVFFAFLFATPYLEGNIANAENFMLLPIIIAGLLVYSIVEADTRTTRPVQKKIFAAGFLLGLAFLFKIVAVFDFLAFTLFLFLTSALRREKNKKHSNTHHFHYKSEIIAALGWLRADGLFLVLGFLLPILCAFLYFTLQGSLPAFIQSAFFGNVTYVGYGNTFIIPQGFLIIKIIVFILALLFIISRSKSITRPLLFITLWFVFALFSAFFSQRPYTHYLLMLLPSFCLLAGLLFTSRTPHAKAGIGVLVILVTFIAVQYFNVYGIAKTFRYYENAVQFLNGQKTVAAYQAFFDLKTPRDYELVSYIKNHTNQSDKIFLWGDSPQIYALSNKLPPGKYTVAYHIVAHKGAVSETQAAIDKTKPKFIITLSEAPPLPFHLPAYTAKYSIKGATIYERTH